MPDRDLDPAYLRDVQYRDDTQLAKRANLHVAYRTAATSGFAWFAGLIDWPADSRVLDVGCGSGLLWDEVAAVVADGVHLSLVDLSKGMIDEAVRRVTATGRFASVDGRAMDARLLDEPVDHYDVIVSTYALYHVPGAADVVSRLVGALRPDGQLAIMTNGPGHLAEIEAVRVEVLGPEAAYTVNHSFTPAVATSTLVEHFDDVAWRRYHDTLEVTDAADVLAFITSSPPAATDEQIDAMRRIIARSMEQQHGVFQVSKHTGAVIGRSKVRRR